MEWTSLYDEMRDVVIGKNKNKKEYKTVRARLCKLFFLVTKVTYASQCHAN